MVKETRKILGTDDIAVTATCIRVPVMRAHAEAINLELDRELSEDEARDILASAPGVSLSDDRQANRRGFHTVISAVAIASADTQLS